MAKNDQIVGPYWTKHWIEKMWRYTSEKFVDFDTGSVDFEALGREEYEFRKALFYRNFKNSPRAKEAFEETAAGYKTYVENGKKGGRPRKNKESTEDGDIREDSQDVATSGNGSVSESGTSANHYGDASHREAGDESTAVSNNSEVRQGKRTGGIPAVRGNAKAVTSPARSFGANGNVRLTIESGKKLRELYGEDLDLAISFLDGYIQDLPSKELGQPKGGSKFWKEEYLAKDHASVLRYGNWVWKKVQEAKTTEARRTNAEQGGKAFKSQAEKNDEAIARIESYYGGFGTTDGNDNIVRIAK